MGSSPSEFDRVMVTTRTITVLWKGPICYWFSNILPCEKSWKQVNLLSKLGVSCSKHVPWRNELRSGPFWRFLKWVLQFLQLNNPSIECGRQMMVPCVRVSFSAGELLVSFSVDSLKWEDDWRLQKLLLDFTPWSYQSWHLDIWTANPRQLPTLVEGLYQSLMYVKHC